MIRCKRNKTPQDKLSMKNNQLQIDPRSTCPIMFYSLLKVTHFHQHSLIGLFSQRSYQPTRLDFQDMRGLIRARFGKMILCVGCVEGRALFELKVLY